MSVLSNPSSVFREHHFILNAEDAINNNMFSKHFTWETGGFGSFEREILELWSPYSCNHTAFKSKMLTSISKERLLRRLYAPGNSLVKVNEQGLGPYFLSEINGMSGQKEFHVL